MAGYKTWNWKKSRGRPRIQIAPQQESNFGGKEQRQVAQHENVTQPGTPIDEYNEWMIHDFLEEELGPVQMSNFLCAESNVNEQDPLSKLICIWFST